MDEKINDSISETAGSTENNDEQLRELIRKNYELTQEIYAMTKKIKSYITFQKIMSFIYFVLIVGPIILGIIYLPPLLGNIVGQYEQLLGVPDGNFKNIFKSGSDQDLDKVKQQLDEILKNQGE